jgi:hypothetical protein
MLIIIGRDQIDKPASVISRDFFQFSDQSRSHISILLGFGYSEDFTFYFSKIYYNDFQARRVKIKYRGLNLCLYSEIGFLRVTFGQQDSFITDLPGLMILLPGW